MRLANLGNLIHFKIKMSLPIGDLSRYFSSKWQFAYLEYLCGVERSRICFQTSLFSGFKYLKIARASRGGSFKVFKMYICERVHMLIKVAFQKLTFQNHVH